MSPVWCDDIDPADRDSWLTWRRDGVGASDLGAICGMSPFGTPTSVYLDKVGLLDDTEPTSPMRWGKLLEEPIAREFERVEGLFVGDEQVCVQDAEHAHRRCTLDGLVYEGTTHLTREHALGVVEIKTTRDRPWDEVPDAYAIQVQWQLGIVGMQHAWLAALHGGNTLRVYEFDFDELLYAHLCRIADRFWDDHVLVQNPPLADGSEPTSEAIKAAYRDRANDTTVTLDDLGTHLAHEWLSAERLLKNVEAYVERLKNQLRTLLAENTIGIDGQGDELVTWKPQNTAGRLDVAALRRAHPQLAAEFTGPARTTRVLRATKTLRQLAGESEGANA